MPSGELCSGACVAHLQCSLAKMLPAPTAPFYSREGTLACYWETYLYPEFSSTNIESNLCNHIIYGDVKLDKTTWKLTHKNRTIDVDLGGFRNVSAKVTSKSLVCWVERILRTF